jgi:hypothetical protein
MLSYCTQTLLFFNTAREIDKYVDVSEIYVLHATYAELAF